MSRFKAVDVNDPKTSSELKTICEIVMQIVHRRDAINGLMQRKYCPETRERVGATVGNLEGEVVRYASELADLLVIKYGLITGRGKYDQ